MNEAASVTVVIPWGTVNSPWPAVASALAQGRCVKEIFLLRNGTALTGEVRLKVPYFDDKLRIVDLPRCANANIARNVGLLLGSASFVAYLDADDSYPLGYLEAAIFGLEAEQADVSISSLKVTDRNGVRFLRASLDGFEGIENYLFCHNAGSSSGLVVRTETRRACLWSWSLRRHQDYDYIARLFKDFPTIFRDDIFISTNRAGRRLGIKHIEDAFGLCIGWEQKVKGAYWRAHVWYLVRHLPFSFSWPAMFMLMKLIGVYLVNFFSRR